jgi:hypothetical protein
MRIASSKSVIVNDMREMKGKILRDGAVEILEEPFFDEQGRRWCALANAWGCLCIIELSVKQLPEANVGAC